MPIQEGMWRRYIDILDRDGKVSKKVQLEMILALCEAVEDIEKKLDEKDQPLQSSKN